MKLDSNINYAFYSVLFRNEQYSFRTTKRLSHFQAVVNIAQILQGIYTPSLLHVLW